MYGQAKTLTTNSQGFRNTQNFTPQVPEGRVRLVCAGDSFTLGFGVADDETWCHLLESHDPRLQTVNLGQGGYGLGQAYLWYKRNHTKLDHGIVVFAFVSEDFARLQLSDFRGYGKPTFTVVDERIVTLGVPVSRSAYRLPYGSAVYKLSVVKYFRRLPFVRELRERKERDRAPWHFVVHAIFADLSRISAEQGSQLTLVYLPTIEDAASEENDDLRAVVRGIAADLGIPLLDLVPGFRKLSADAAAALFFPYKSRGLGHFSEAGNAHVARLIHERLDQGL